MMLCAELLVVLVGARCDNHVDVLPRQRLVCESEKTVSVYPRA